MSPSICHNFVQNAWKKDLCSNCFKAREEHNIEALNGIKSRLTNDPKISTIQPHGIIKTVKKSTKKKFKVNFPKDESEIIGYGGEEWTSDTEEFELSEECPEDAVELAPEDDTERELQRLTKSNTDFNMVNSNLLGENAVTETRRVFASLMLGKTQTDSEGKKQTLHVSVTPFGAQEPPKKLNHQPIAKNKELSLTDNKTPVILTSYSNKKEMDKDEKSLLEEINETLEKNKFKNNKNEEKNKENVIPFEKKGKIIRHAAIKKDQEKPVIKVVEAKNEVRFVKTEVLEVTDVIESRELAGEPDGKADEIVEPPALPLTPPPVTPPPTDLRPSFLHKPKVPAKPNIIKVPEPSPTPSSSDGDDTVSTDSTYEKIPLSKSDSSNSCSDNRKRRAPKPPLIPTASPIYTKCDRPSNEKSPVVREKEKRASSCSPKLRNTTTDSTPNLTQLPEPAPRRSISLSQDSLSSPPELEKKKSRNRFSLKKFLRMGNGPTKDLPKDEPPIPQPKPRLVIVHPTDLLEPKKERPGKPPPPPRNQENELLRQQKIWGTPNSKENIYANVGEVRAILTPSKPVRTASMRERERNDQNYEPVRHDDDSSETTENVYDFISSSSNDETQSSSPQQRSSSPECDSTTPVITNLRPKVDKARTNGLARRSDGNLEHCPFRQNTISLPYCGSETESEIYSPYSFYGSEADVGDDESDWTNSCARTSRLRSRKGRSIVHKNLEDNYGAVVVANHEALAQVLEHMHQTSTIQPALRGLKTAPNLRWIDFSLVENSTCNITQSTVHIGKRCFHTALWGAHHVTLALTMEQGSMLQTNTLALAPFTLVPITEFSDLVPSNYLPIESKDSNSEQVTIAVLPWMQVETIQSMGTLLRSKQTTSTTPTPLSNELNSRPLLNSTVSEELICREACFVMLQLINGLKCLQAQGIEELPLNLTSFALCREIERDTHPRLCVLQGLSEEISRIIDNDTLSKGDDTTHGLGSLCECALRALKHLVPAITPTTSNLISLLEEILKRERAISLTQVKSILEFQLWGPSDVALTTPIKDRELALQRWLDLERATVLHGLVRTRVQLTVFEECHLLFLVRSTAKMMCDASVLLDSIN